VEMFEGDSADTCTGKIPLMLMGGRAEDLAWVTNILPGLLPHKNIRIQKKNSGNIFLSCLHSQFLTVFRQFDLILGYDQYD
jgi:hypothetical protein